MSSETTAQGTLAYTYDTAGRRQTLQVTGLPPVTYGYDANSRLTGVAQGTQSAALQYDSANRRTTLTLPNGITVAYTYDEANRLISQTYTGPGGPLGDLTYQYDAAGNRTGTGGAFARTLVPQTIASSTYDQANQQLAFGSLTQTFDANGNLLTQTDGSGTTTYTWDARNRLVGIAGPGVSATFAYDALGRRVSKSINGVTTTFLYDGLDIVGETSGGETATYLRTLAIDDALTRTDSSGTATYLADTLGSTVALADGSGAAVTSYSYEPFGETSVSGTASPNPFQFTGRENDGMGLYYYRARYYSPRMARFLGEDPLRFSAGINFYSYADNNPLTLKDPLGQEVRVCHRPMQVWSTYTHTYLYSTKAGQGWGLATGWVKGFLSAFDICKPGEITNDRPYDDQGQPKPDHQCTESEPSPCVEACVIRRAAEQTRTPPNYCVGRYQCQDWVADMLQKCRTECPR